MSPRALLLALALIGPAPAAAALGLDLPEGANRSAARDEALGSYALPVGPWVKGKVETLAAEGAVSQTAWRIRDSEATTLQLFAPLRDQIAEEGFEILFECEAAGCGGFDFRYAVEILPEPEMHVDLGDFRVLTAIRQKGGAPEYVNLIVSRSSSTGFVQMTRIGPAGAEPLAMAASTKTPAPGPSLLPAPAALAERLEATGAVALDDLAFETGSANLGPGEFASLAGLAAYLRANPDHRLTLVGHTDAEGSLAANVALSKRRAESVLERLVAAHGIPRAQLQAEGVGFLSPRASNLTGEGRMQNRRVEAMLSSTE